MVVIFPLFSFLGGGKNSFFVLVWFGFQPYFCGKKTEMFTGMCVLCIPETQTTCTLIFSYINMQEQFLPVLIGHKGANRKF